MKMLVNVYFIIFINYRPRSITLFCNCTIRAHFVIYNTNREKEITNLISWRSLKVAMYGFESVVNTLRYQDYWFCMMSVIILQLHQHNGVLYISNKLLLSIIKSDLKNCKHIDLMWPSFHYSRMESTTRLQVWKWR